MSRYSVILNFPDTRKRKIPGVIDFINDEIRTFNNRDEAVDFCHNHAPRCKQGDTLYVMDNNLKVEGIEEKGGCVFFLKV